MPISRRRSSTTPCRFMFETRFPQHLTAFAGKEAPLQDDYVDCWDGIEKKFDGTPEGTWDK